MSETVETKSKGVGAKELLEMLWTDRSRPSLQWLWMHSGRDVPAVKIGNKYIYNPEKVKAALGLS